MYLQTIIYIFTYLITVQPIYMKIYIIYKKAFTDTQNSKNWSIVCGTQNDGYEFAPL